MANDRIVDHYHGRGVLGPLGEITIHYTDGSSEKLEPSGRFSPDGFLWGYIGPGPTETAFSILCHHFGADPQRLFFHEFKWAVVAEWPEGSEWELAPAAIENLHTVVEDRRAALACR